MDYLLSSSFLHLLAGAFFAILFLQSGFDKVFDFVGNLAWLQGHFAKSPLKGQVKLLLLIITLVEVAAGLCSGLGVLWALWEGSTLLIYWGVLLSALSLLMLFFGQRMAKDYAGAGALVPYFVLALLVLHWLR